MGRTWSTSWSTAIAVAATLVGGCSGPDDLLARADQSGERADYEFVIERFPESSEAGTARDRISEIEAWAETSNALEAASYQAFLAKHPTGRNATTARDRVADVAEYANAKSGDTVESYDTYLGARPSGLFAKEAVTRREVLLPAAQSYGNAAAKNDVAALIEAAKQLHGTGYEALAARTAEALAGGDAMRQVVELDRSIASSSDPVSKLRARETRERLLVDILSTTGGVGRWTLPGVEVYSKNPFSSHPSDSTVKPFRMSLSEGETATRRQAATFDPPDGRLNLFVDLPGDVVAVGMGPGLMISGGIQMGFGYVQLLDDGSATAVGFARLLRHAKSVWRFHGTVDFPGTRIVSGETDPISFYLIEGVGAVYLAGQGRVEDGEGNVLFDTAGIAPAPAVPVEKRATPET